MAKKVLPENKDEGKETPQIEVPDTEELSPEISRLLKIFNGYNMLYIDSYGGVFTADTPEKLRGNAKLYNNPYHKQ